MPPEGRGAPTQQTGGPWAQKPPDPGLTGQWQEASELCPSLCFAPSSPGPELSPLVELSRRTGAWVADPHLGRPQSSRDLCPILSIALPCWPLSLLSPVFLSQERGAHKIHPREAVAASPCGPGWAVTREPGLGGPAASELLSGAQPL